MSKIASNFSLNEKAFVERLKVQFNLHKGIVRGIDDEVVAIVLREGNLYQMNFIKVHGDQFDAIVEKKWCI